MIRDINGEPTRGAHYDSEENCCSERFGFQLAVFSHEQREANQEAHRLAHLVTTLDIGRHVWFSPPDDLNIPVNIMIFS